MSDEKWDVQIEVNKVANIALDLADKRLSALEDNLSPSLWKRISELEKKFSNHTHSSNGKEIAELRERIRNNFAEDVGASKLNLDAHVQLENRLNELRNQIQNNSIVDLNHFEIFQNWSRGFEQAHNFQLTELKEDRDSLHRLIDMGIETDKKQYHQIDDLKEVLRELWKRYYTHLKLGHKEIVMVGEEFIEKLDGKKKVKKTDSLDSLLHGIDPAFLDGSEKKEVCSFLSKDNRCQKQAPCDEEFNFLMMCPATTPIKASGGEKRCIHEYEIRDEFEICKLCGYISPKRIKPPEPMERKDCLYWTPIHKCNYFNEALNTSNLNCQKCTAYKTKEERVRDATRQEPRENDFDDNWYYGTAVDRIRIELISEFVEDLLKIRMCNILIDKNALVDKLLEIIKKWEDKLK